MGTVARLLQTPVKNTPAFNKIHTYRIFFSTVNRLTRFFSAPRVALTIHIILTLIVAITIAPDLPHFTGDPANIVRRSVQVSEGVSPLAFPDPPLRYPPISVLILLLSPLEVSPALITLTFTLAVEFVAIPVAFWAMLKEWLQKRAVATSIYVGAMLMFSTYPWPNTALEMSFWMYAYPVPFVFFAFRHATRGTIRDDVLSGIALGIAALLQFFVAGFAAVVVALMRCRSPKSVGRIALVSMITSTPLGPYFLRYFDYILNYGSERAALSLSLSALETLALVFIVTGIGLLFVIWRVFPESKRVLSTPFPLAVFGSLAIGGTIIAAVFDGPWLRVVLSYISKFAIYGVSGAII
jgi:hypothetical protein